MTGLPRLSVRPEGAVTRRELAEALGYSPASLPTVLADHPEWPGPVGLIRQGRVWVMLYDLAARLRPCGWWAFRGDCLGAYRSLPVMAATV